MAMHNMTLKQQAQWVRRRMLLELKVISDALVRIADSLEKKSKPPKKKKK